MVAKSNAIASAHAVPDTEQVLARMQATIEQLRKSLDETTALLAQMQRAQAEKKPPLKNA